MVQRVLTEKQRPFSAIFIGVSKCTKNLAHFENKDQLHSLSISEVIGPDKYGYFDVRKLLF